MSGRNRHDNLTRHHLVNDHSASRDAHAHAPFRPQRAKRPIPDSVGVNSLGSSVSQLSLLDNHSMTSVIASSSLPSSPSTVSLASSFVDARQLDSGVDLQEPPRPVNRRSNRDFRIIPATEIEVMNESSLQDSIRHSQALHRSLSQKSFQNNKDQKDQTHKQGNEIKKSLDFLKSSNFHDTYEDEGDSYFGDILDKYCYSDEDPVSSLSASPASSLSSAPGSRIFESIQPPTPPDLRPNKQREKDTITTTLKNNQLHPETPAYNQYERNRNNSFSGLSLTSPTSAVSTKLSTYQRSAIASDSRDSLTMTDSSSSPSSRAYTRKAPPPPPKDDMAAPCSSALKQASVSTVPPRTTSSSSSGLSPFHPLSVRREGQHHSSDSLLDLRETKPEPPPKDSSRRAHSSHNMNGSSATNSQPPVLSLDSHSVGHSNSFLEVVEASMNRHRVASSVANNVSGLTYNAPQSYSSSSLSSQTKNDSSHSHSSGTSQHGMGRTSSHWPHQGSAPNNLTTKGYDNKDEIGHGHGQRQESRVSHNQPHHIHQGHAQHRHQLQHRPNQAHPQHHSLSSIRDGFYRMHGSTSQLDLTDSGFKSHPSPAPFLNERLRSYSQGSIATTSSSTRHEYLGPSRSPKSALVKTPIARARSKEVHGARKVIFGDMITIVTIERAETPPPPPQLDKKARKKLLQAKKKAAGKGGQMHNFDPEYNAAYFDAPYTPTPSEVVVTMAPWIGNPNYDEEKQNSKFYYDDEYDYEDYDEEYEAPYESDIRLGPDDDDEEEEEEEEEEEGEENGTRSWGHGIVGPGGSLPKKKSGMFKFKRAVNKLLR
ncbi:hypothetical protein BCR41DRAFT_356164, partial [Lobosporangium transversale]